MLNFTNERSFASRASSASYDMGLRTYMIKVYNMMAVALGISGLTAFLISSSPALMSLLFATPLKWVVMFSPLLFIIFVGRKFHQTSAENGRVLLWIFSAIMGVSMASIFAYYTGQSIARTFFISASVFGFAALYGYTTKKDLTSMSSFLMMGLIGLLVASLVNIFLGSSALQFAISILGVLIFTGLTAYDSQRIKEMYYYTGGDSESSSRAAVIAALSLYLDFINMFQFMLQFFGDRK